MDKKMLIVLAVAVLVSAGGGFAAGYFLKAGSPGGSGFSGRGRSGAQGQDMQDRVRRSGANNAGIVRGSVIFRDAASVTVKLDGGGSANVFYSDATHVVKSVDASAADLAPDVEISAMGTKNSDGSITAQSIMIGGGGFGASAVMGSPGSAGGGNKQ